MLVKHTAEPLCRDGRAEVTGQVPEGTEQVQNQGNTGATGGQEEHQNNGTTEGQQDQTTAQVNTEGQTQGAESLEERRSSNRNLLRRFLQVAFHKLAELEL